MAQNRVVVVEGMRNGWIPEYVAIREREKQSRPLRPRPLEEWVSLFTETGKPVRGEEIWWQIQDLSIRHNKSETSIRHPHGCQVGRKELENHYYADIKSHETR